MVKNVLLLLLDGLTEWLDPERAKERAAWQTAYEQYQRVMRDGEKFRQDADAEIQALKRESALARSESERLRLRFDEQQKGYANELQKLQVKLAALDALPDADVLLLPIGGSANGQS